MERAARRAPDEEPLENLPNLSSDRVDAEEKNGRKPLILRAVDALNEGSTTDVGNTQFKLNRRQASILTNIGDAAVEMAVNRHQEAKIKARTSMFGGDLEAEANRDAEGKHRFNIQYRKQF